MQATETPTQPNRRDFFKKVSAACIGAFLTLVPLFSGLAVFLDEWALRPGFPWMPELSGRIKSVKSAAVFLSAAGAEDSGNLGLVICQIDQIASMEFKFVGEASSDED